MKAYHVLKNGEKVGPFTRREMKTALAAGVIDESDEIEFENTTVAQLLNGPPPLPGSESTAPPPPTMLEQHLAAQRGRSSGLAAQPPKKSSHKALWIGISVAVVLMIGAGGFLFFIGKQAKDVFDMIAELSIDYTEQSELPLLQDREGHVTQWIESSFEAVGEADEPPADVFQKVHYPSPAGDLVAYLTPDPGDGERKPAVVWAHGGFGGIGASFWMPASRKNDQSARAFREAGIVLMCPSWRGENDNPGQFELFYGEVDDLLAAVAYVKSLPYVDPERVYVAGHSTGGTLALLASAAQVDCRAVFSFGGAPDMHSVMEDDDGYGNTPYSLDSERDHDLRNPSRYIKHFRVPTFYFEGTDSWYTIDAETMGEMAETHEVVFEDFELPGDHFDILAPTTALVADKILADNGPQCTIEFSLPELEAAWNALHDVSLSETLQEWMTEGGELSAALAPLEDDAAVSSVDDSSALVSAIKKSVASDRVSDLVTLVGLQESSGIREANLLFSDKGAPVLRDWARSKMSNFENLDEATIAAVFEVLSVLATNGTAEDGELITEFATSGFDATNDEWSSVLWNLQIPSPAFFATMKSFHASLPPGKIGYYVLRRGNSAFLDDDWKGPHPFDSPAGRERMQQWFQADDEGSFNIGGAYFSAVALAFVSDATREGLVPMALAVPDTDVQLEAAWADVKTNGSLGLARLQQACRDAEFATTAKSYLEELGKSDAIPDEALDPEFTATADITDWLKHPNELGRVPETLKVYDTRTLYWPPSDKQLTVWLFEFTYRFGSSKDDPTKTGYAMAGTTNWSFFDEFPEPPPAKQLYATHCAWELTNNSESFDDDPKTYTEEEATRLLRKGNANW